MVPLGLGERLRSGGFIWASPPMKEFVFELCSDSGSEIFAGQPGRNTFREEIQVLLRGSNHSWWRSRSLIWLQTEPEAGLWLEGSRPPWPPWQNQCGCTGTCRRWERFQMFSRQKRILSLSVLGSNLVLRHFSITSHIKIVHTNPVKWHKINRQWHECPTIKRNH